MISRWRRGNHEGQRQFSELTTQLADLTAKRNQLEAGVRTHRDRLARLDQEIASVQAEESKLAQETGNLGDIDALAAAMEMAQQTLAESEAAVQSSEAHHAAARQTLEASRNPLAEAEKRQAAEQAEAARREDGDDEGAPPPIAAGARMFTGPEFKIEAAHGDEGERCVNPTCLY